MPILVHCECGGQFQARDEDAGKLANCPGCGKIQQVPPVGAIGRPLSPRAEHEDASTSGKAITSLVLGVLSFFCVFFTGIPAIILGIIGLNDISRGQGRIKGRGLAITGIITGALGCTFVVAFLVGLLIPVTQAARSAARRVQCMNNLRHIGIGMLNYMDTKGTYPPAAISDGKGNPLLSWRVAILPYIGQKALYDEFHLDEPWDSPHNKTLVTRMPLTYTCPSEPLGGNGTTSFQVIVGPQTLFSGIVGVPIRQVTDGTGITLMVVEAREPVTWTKPADLEVGDLGQARPLPALGRSDAGGFNALFASGSVRFIPQSMSQEKIRAMITPHGGENLTIEDLPLEPSSAVKARRR